MFEVLLESGPHAQLRARWLTTAVVTHTLIAIVAVLATKAAFEGPIAVPERAILLFVPKPPEPPPPPEPKAEPAAPSVVTTEPPPKGFQTVAAPIDIPNLIPPIDLKQRPLDPRDFTGRGVEGGVAHGVVGGTGPVELDAIYEASTTLEGFEPAVVVSQPRPRYPATLAAVGIEGRVMVEFVIDTTGRVEPASIRATESSHPAFEAAARTTMQGSVFRPARLGNRPVRQLTRQSVRFVAAH
ncbi:MAG TPA: TonB family protein [Gemmatimonadales bacterium]|nr:TonB family protein [Gemmatimonadales bacterium]